ncbi:GDP-mannose mannosyl hydrolase [Thiomicrorhabdus arctica]|uniref:GDP-mannose mannosyl hydrolase n=1 Tax=Thiomicrorhabdus arctica TaxID=131540 RepID=UPI000369F4B3|nr:NUDIX domain-containing protein [Thiomicrorhabdus arctica]
MLSLTKFESLIETAPLVAIDLIIKSSSGVLLGKRNNQPAKDFWFVPGGRVLKNECLSHAIKRISLKEVNLEKSLSNFKFIGIFEHFYDNSFVSESITTHYVVLAFELECGDSSLETLPSSEHNEYRYFSLRDLESDPLVHTYTKKYFNSKGVV